jgi:hypothetical protein
MNPRLVEFALRKQALQFRAQTQREDMLSRLEGVEDTLDTVDRLCTNLAWARQQVPLFSAAAVAVVLWKPRLALRVARRAWLGWALYRRLGAAMPLFGSLLRRWRGASAGRG